MFYQLSTAITLSNLALIPAQFAECPDNHQPILESERQILINAYSKITENSGEVNLVDISYQNGMKNLIKTKSCINSDMYNYLMEAASNGKNRKTDFNCHDAECDIPITLKGIWGYGCWCNFGSSLLQGRGTPVDAHDAVCRDMQLCLRCAEMDSVEGNYACDVKRAEYNSVLSQSTYLGNVNDNEHSINSQCSEINENNFCGTHICTCEVQLINDLLELVWQFYTHDSAPRHPSNPYGGSFDYESSCQKPPPGTSELKCCGKYPYRFPYNSNNKDCCEVPENKVYQAYHPFEEVCCADGVKRVDEGGC